MSESERVGTVVSKDLKREIEAEAIRRSEPGARVTVSEILRETLEEHFDGGDSDE